MTSNGNITASPSRWRTLLVLGRVSNLPTVWSNCVAGWLLGGAGEYDVLLTLCLCASLLYIGGMFLNDAFDADFDRAHRSERPIPLGQISEKEVWTLGFLWMALGLAPLLLMSRPTLLLALALSGAILLYDAWHKSNPASPILMAACRVLLLLLAASCGFHEITGLAVWSSLVLGCYVAGLSYVAKAESIQSNLKFWPCLLIAAPVALAFVVNRREFLQPSLLASAVLLGWSGWALWQTFGKRPPAIGKTVSALLAGIVWVDLLCVTGVSTGWVAVFVALFALARWFQRSIPAT